MTTLSRSLRGAVLAIIATVSGNGMSAGISDGEIRVALMTDMENVMSDLAGQGSVIAAQMAIEDFGGHINGHRIRLFPVSHNSDGELAISQIQDLHSRKNIDVIADMVMADTAIPLQGFAARNAILALHSGSDASTLTGANCSRTGIHWGQDTYALASGIVQASGGIPTKWFFVTADTYSGHNLERDARARLEAADNTVLDVTRHRFGTQDFGEYILAARNSQADFIALASSGADARHAIRELYEHDSDAPRQATLVGLSLSILDIRQLGLYIAQNLLITTDYYWDQNEASRAWANRFLQRHGTMPTHVHAAVYSSLTHYFKAVEAAGTDDALAVARQMRAMPVNDFFANNGYIREDGRLVRDIYLTRVKRPSQSRHAWDYLEIIDTISGEFAFRPLTDSDCPLLSME
ncbi:hypothetical protein CAI21_19640 [Alkalilimnicola ehrlichii]|nr:ABC transporter substrate-binding protein [Alkalilimnicola ehrlichii]RFA25185.1 hypothetical protein CAI21_19640 [Alkalilimnicola ehrlichii]